MKNFTLSILTAAFSLLLSLNISAQSYGTVQLPTPNNLTPLFLGSLTDSKIYYGADNGSTDKPVLVFVHGFIDLANAWFLPGNRMYEDAYYGGYRNAYVAMTRGGGMWENGALLAEMLEDITAHYGVNDVVIVAHSNGGKASEVAMFHHGKRNLVNRVISLGTPFKGTELANLAETWAFNWLVDFIGLGGGTSTSTTYYMGGVARPYFDNLSNNQGNKFFNFGAWGYNSGTTIAAPTMLTGGLILNVNGSGWLAGGNDGVTPYWSSKRPGGASVWTYGYGNWRSKHDHIDVAMNYIVWDPMEPYFTGPLGQLRASAVEPEHRPSRSNVQYLSSEAGQMEFMVEEDAQEIKVHILHGSESDVFQIQTENGEMLVCKNKETVAGHIGKFATNITLDYLEPGRYSIVSENRFGALVSYDNGVELVLRNDLDAKKSAYAPGENITLNLSLENGAGNYTDAEVTAVLSRRAFDGNALMEKDEDLKIVQLTNVGENEFAYTFEDGLVEGVYNVMVQVNDADFAKGVIGGFAVKASNETNVAATAETLNLDFYPNPVQDVVSVSFDSDEDTELRIFDTYGRLVTEFSINGNDGFLQFDTNDIIPHAGNYFIQLQNGNQQVVKSLVKVD